MKYAYPVEKDECTRLHVQMHVTRGLVASKGNAEFENIKRIDSRQHLFIPMVLNRGDTSPWGDIDPM